jgi:hypothetical protein
LHEPTITVGGLPATAGDHICAFYRGRAQRDEILMPFLSEGVRAGDKCMCLISAGEQGRIRSEVGESQGLLDLVDSRSTYLRTGTFVGEHMMEFWQQWARQVFELEGLTFGRAACEMSWAEELRSSPALGELVSYEAKVNKVARNFPWVALCLYDLDLFGGDVVVPMLKTHPKVLFSGMLVENPYFVDPDEMLV